MSYRTKFALFVLILAALLLVAACARESRQDQPVTTTTNAGTSTAPPAADLNRRKKSLVRVVNALPGGSSVDVFVDNTKAFTNIAYKSVTPYTEQPDERHTLRVRPAGQDAAQALAENTAELDDGEHFTAVVLSGADGKPILRVIDDNLTAPSSGKAKVRLIHAAPDAGEIKLYVQGKTDELLDAESESERKAEYEQIDPMMATLEVRHEDDKNVLLQIPNAKFEAGKIYTIVIMGRAKGTPKLEAVTFEDQLGGARAMSNTSTPTSTTGNSNAGNR